MIIILPGKPVPQARHRTYFHGSLCRYVDPSCRDKKIIRQNVEAFLKEHYPDFEMFKFPRISCLFQFSYPLRMPVKLKQAAKQGLLKHMTKPDVDNLLKLILDAFTGILYKDDKTVSLGPCVKTYDEHPKTIVQIEETSDLLYPWELKPLVYNPEADYPQRECTCHISGCLRNHKNTRTFELGEPCPRCGDINPSAFEEFMSVWRKGIESGDNLT